MPDSARKGSLAVIFLTVFVDLLGFGMVIPLLPIYANHFNATKWELGFLMASFSLMQFFFMPLWGRLSDRIGRRPVLMVGLVASIVCYTLFGVATVMKSFALLMASRIGAGIAGATISTAQAYIADCTPPDKRSKGMALIGMAFGMGFTFGPMLAYFACPAGKGDPGPWPGYVAAILSAGALGMAIFLLPESRTPDSQSAARRIFDIDAYRIALRTPSVGLLLVAIFVCIFSFANFETTLSMVIKGRSDNFDAPFEFTWRQVCLTYAYIGIVLAAIQGGLVRRLAGKFSEGKLAVSGAVIEIIGFGFVFATIYTRSLPLLLLAMAIVACGFAFMQPNLNALLSRRSDPKNQGTILGVGQSVSSAGRIVGAALGIPLLKTQIELPYVVAAVLMTLGVVLILLASARGRDYESTAA